MAQPAPAVEALDLVKDYQGRRALEGVTLDVDRGETMAIVGPNGAGKTTTVEILEGYRRADGGTARVLGLDPQRDGRALRPRIGVMLQEGGIYPGIRPLEALRLFASYYPAPRNPDELLAAVGLDDARTTTVRHLSGGQRQRLALALALVGNPEVLFLDEPTAGMDPRARAATWELVRVSQREGTAVLLTTHAMDEAEALADRVAVMDNGCIVAIGTPSELRSAQPRPDTQFSARPGLPSSDLARALGVDPGAVRETRPGQYEIGAPPTANLVADLTAWLRDRDVVLGDLRAGTSSLEEVYLRLTQERSAAEERPAS